MVKQPNPCAKRISPQTAYEIWRVEDHPDYGGQWTWYVLKKYQLPEKENEYSRWFCFVTSPHTQNGDWGDTYIKTIKDTGAIKLDYNPLVQSTEGENDAKNQVAS